MNSRFAYSALFVRLHHELMSLQCLYACIGPLSKTGCLLLAHWPRGVRTKAGLFSLVGTSGLHVKDIKAVR